MPAPFRWTIRCACAYIFNNTNIVVTNVNEVPMLPVRVCPSLTHHTHTQTISSNIPHNQNTNTNDDFKNAARTYKKALEDVPADKLELVVHEGTGA